MIRNVKEELKKYIPNIILERLEKEPTPIKKPFSEKYNCSFLFVDIAEFSTLTEKVIQQYENGLEIISNILSIYLEQLIRIITNAGGDIVKFAGDALFVVWKLNDDEYNEKKLSEKIYLATLCGLEIQDKLFQFDVGGTIKLSVRVGISSGIINAMHVGGAFARWEFVITGEALSKAAEAQRKANPGEVVISKSAWSILEKYSYGMKRGKRFLINLPKPQDKVKLLNQISFREFNLSDETIPILKNYVPRAIISRIEEGFDSWHIEFLQVSILFIKIGSNTMKNLSYIDKVQEIMKTVQMCIYTYEGSINRFGVDDKGAVILSAFGLPPLIHNNDPERAILASIYLQNELKKIGYVSQMGIATGKVFCGTIGNEIRSEYTMHGTNVNFAARLMQISDGIVCDDNTYNLTKDKFDFTEMPPRKFKGKLQEVVYYKLNSKKS